jgi:hypothetical protein
MIINNTDNFEIFNYNNNKDKTTSILSEYFLFSPLSIILFTTRDHETITRYTGLNIIDINKIDNKKSRKLFLRNL